MAPGPPTSGRGRRPKKATRTCSPAVLSACAHLGRRAATTVSACRVSEYATGVISRVSSRARLCPPMTMTEIARRSSAPGPVPSARESCRRPARAWSSGLAAAGRDWPG